MAAAGWYPDPWQRGGVRWFDGSVWTPHVRPAQPPPPPRRGANPGCVTLLVLFLVLTIGVPFVGGVMLHRSATPEACRQPGAEPVVATEGCVADPDMGPYLGLLALGGVVFVVGLFYAGWAKGARG